MTQEEMTQFPKLTKKEWTILKFFIVRESSAIDYKSISPHKQNKDLQDYFVPDHFYSYPDDIVMHLTKHVYTTKEEKDSYYSEIYRDYIKDIREVTVPTAGKACREFFKREIFEQVKEKRTKKKFQKTTQYFLKTDFETFKNVLFLLMQNCESYERLEILSHSYFRKTINEDLVRRILFEKKVSILGKIDIFDWAPDEVPMVLTILENIKEEKQTNFEEEIQERIKECENKSLYRDNNASDWFFLPIIQCLIPIFPESISLKEKMKIIEETNRFDQNEKLAFTQFPSVFDNHFEVIEQEQLILPILALIQCSPEALREFIFGKWESFKLSRGIFHKGNEKSCSPFFRRLIALAMSDVESTLSFPENKNIKSFELREIPQNLAIDSNREKEDALLRIRLTREYDIYYDMGYSVSNKKYHSIMPRIREIVPLENEFWVKIWMKEASSLFIRKIEIKDIILFLTLLKAKNQVSTHIRSKLSNRIQNLILRYKCINAPAPEFIMFLIKDLNRILLREDFFDEKAFSEIEISPETQQIIDEYSRSKRYYEQNNTGSNYLILIYRNRLLIEAVFTGAISRYGEMQY